MRRKLFQLEVSEATFQVAFLGLSLLSLDFKHSLSVKSQEDVKRGNIGP